MLPSKASTKRTKTTLNEFEKRTSKWKNTNEWPATGNSNRALSHQTLASENGERIALYEFIINQIQGAK